MSGDKVISQSPTAVAQSPSAPVKKTETKGITFPSAMIGIINGQKMTRLEWDNPNIYIHLFGNKLCIRKEDGKSYPLIVSDGDMLGEDWVVVL